MSTPTTPTTTDNNTEKPVVQETHQVFVGNLSFTSTNETIKAHFSSAGEVLEVVIIKKGSRLQGFGFVGFKTVKEAEKAIKDLDKTELDGREISVQMAKPREEPIKSTEKKKKRKNTSKKSRKSTNSAEGEKQEKTEEEKPTSIVASAEQEEVKPKTSVFVANLPLNYKMDDLAELFKDYQVESALVAIKRSGTSKGYGFVELKSVEEMEKVLKECSEIEVKGRVLHISAATSEKNTERKVKPNNKKPSTDKQLPVDENIHTTGVSKKKRNRKSKKTSLQAKEKEGVSAAHQAQDAVLELKEEDGISAAHQAQEAVRELKEEDGAQAAQKAQKAVKELKGEVSIDAAHKAQDAVKELKKEDGAEAAQKAQGAVKELKKDDGADAAKAANKNVKLDPKK